MYNLANMYNKGAKPLLYLLITATLCSSAYSLRQIIHLYDKPITQVTTVAKPIKRQEVSHHKQSGDLFGQYVPVNLGAKHIPTTILNLRLVGILKATPNQASQAVIDMGNRNEQVYRLNDLLPGHAKIIRIFNNSILILRNGQVERLSLPKHRIIFGQRPTPLEMKT